MSFVLILKNKKSIYIILCLKTSKKKTGENEAEASFSASSEERCGSCRVPQMQVFVLRGCRLIHDKRIHPSSIFKAGLVVKMHPSVHICLKHHYILLF